jgi:hypothetical protein
MESCDGGNEMNREQVIAVIGKSRWRAFSNFMMGQTVGLKDGKIDYYEWDVKNFLEKPKNRYFD